MTFLLEFIRLSMGRFEKAIETTKMKEKSVEYPTTIRITSFQDRSEDVVQVSCFDVERNLSLFLYQNRLHRSSEERK